LEFLERLGYLKYCQALCRRLEYLKHRKRTRETKASNKEEKQVLIRPFSSIADVFGVLVSAKLLLGRRASENRRATGRQSLPRVSPSNTIPW